MPFIVACGQCGTQVHITASNYPRHNGRWLCALCWATRMMAIDEWQCCKCGTVLARMYLKDRFGVVTCIDCVTPVRKVAASG